VDRRVRLESSSRRYSGSLGCKYSRFTLLGRRGYCRRFPSRRLDRLVGLDSGESYSGRLGCKNSRFTLLGRRGYSRRLPLDLS
jgi:hypothetical protein